MATTVEQTTDSGSKTTRVVGQRSLFFGLLFVGLVGGGFVLVPQLVSLTNSDESLGALTHVVKRGGFMITIKEDGNVESAQNVEVKCQIAGGATILWIVEDGKIVEKGEELVRLDQSQLDDQLNSQTIVYEKAMATKIQAEEDFETAVISVLEYKEGLYKKELQDTEALIIIARENLSSSENLLKHTTRMARKGFATQLQLRADQFGVQRANLELQSANLSKKTLTDYTYAKMLKSLEATRDAAEARKRSELAAFNLEKVRKDRLEDQLKYCIVTAPQSGMVVYANNMSRRSSSTQAQIEEGSMVREGQNLIRLPDLTNMQVKVTVHETKVNLLRSGMPARIVIQDKVLDGTVISIANQPEPGSWMSSSIKEYATTVTIDGFTEGLKPGMTAEVEILIADLENVLIVPVAAVVEQRGQFLAWVQTEKGPERRLLSLGQTNDRDIEIKDGLIIGDVVILNPRAVVPEAREKDLDREDSSKKNFGNGKGKSGKGKGSKTNSSEGYPGKGSGNVAKNSGKRSGKGKGGGRSFNLMQFDKDGDGKVSKDEAPAQMQQYFGRLDTNGDGFIDRGEVAASATQRKKGGGKGRPGVSGGGRSE
jgi:multidrug efflux pump subunit AcrA (membrane-fusion protein)